MEKETTIILHIKEFQLLIHHISICGNSSGTWSTVVAHSLLVEDHDGWCDWIWLLMICSSLFSSSLEVIAINVDFNHFINLDWIWLFQFFGMKLISNTKYGSVLRIGTIVDYSKVLIESYTIGSILPSYELVHHLVVTWQYHIQYNTILDQFGNSFLVN